MKYCNINEVILTNEIGPWNIMRREIVMLTCDRFSMDGYCLWDENQIWTPDNQRNYEEFLVLMFSTWKLSSLHSHKPDKVGGFGRQRIKREEGHFVSTNKHTMWQKPTLRQVRFNLSLSLIFTEASLSCGLLFVSPAIFTWWCWQGWNNSLAPAAPVAVCQTSSAWVVVEVHSLTLSQTAGTMARSPAPIDCGALPHLHSTLFLLKDYLHSSCT